MIGCKVLIALAAVAFPRLLVRGTSQFQVVLTVTVPSLKLIFSKAYRLPAMPLDNTRPSLFPLPETQTES